MTEEQKEKKAEYMKAYYLDNKSKFGDYNKAWRKVNKEKFSAQQKRKLLRLNVVNKKLTKRTLSAWSAQIRERDTACLYCGSTSNLHAHHILSKVKHPEHALFLNNGITLCEPCHIQEHTLNGDL